MCEAVLPGPEAAARAAAAAPAKRRAEAEGAIARAVADALHLLGALRQLLPLMEGAQDIRLGVLGIAPVWQTP